LAGRYKKPQRRERGGEIRDKEEGIDDFSLFAPPSSLFTK